MTDGGREGVIRMLAQCQSVNQDPPNRSIAKPVKLAPSPHKRRKHGSRVLGTAHLELRLSLFDADEEQQPGDVDVDSQPAPIAIAGQLSLNCIQPQAKEAYAAQELKQLAGQPKHQNQHDTAVGPLQQQQGRPMQAQGDQPVMKLQHNQHLQTQHGQLGNQHLQPNAKQQSNGVHQPPALQFDEMVPASPNDGQFAAGTAGQALADADDMIPETPDSDVVSASGGIDRGLAAGCFQPQQEQIQNNPCQGPGQQTSRPAEPEAGANRHPSGQHEQQEFAFPSAADKAAAVTPTMDFRSYGRLGLAAQMGLTGATGLAGGAAVTGLVATLGAGMQPQQQPPLLDNTIKQLHNQLGPLHTQQPPVLPVQPHLGQQQAGMNVDGAPLGYQTPQLAANISRAPQAVATAATGANVTGHTPSTNSICKYGVSPSDSDMCALWDSLDRKQGKETVAASIAAIRPAAAVVDASVAGLPAGSTAIAGSVNTAALPPSPVQGVVANGGADGGYKWGVQQWLLQQQLQQQPQEGAPKLQRGQQLLQPLQTTGTPQDSASLPQQPSKAGSELQQQIHLRQHHVLQRGLQRGRQLEPIKQQLVQQDQELTASMKQPAQQQRPAEVNHQCADTRAMQKKRSPQKAALDLGPSHAVGHTAVGTACSAGAAVYGPTPIDSHRLAANGPQLYAAVMAPAAGAKMAGVSNVTAAEVAAAAGLPMVAGQGGVGMHMATIRQLLQQANNLPPAVLPQQQSQELQGLNPAQHRPLMSGQSPAGLADRFCASGSRPGSTGSLTPNTTAALEMLEQQYQQHNLQHLQQQLQHQDATRHQQQTNTQQQHFGAQYKTSRHGRDKANAGTGATTGTGLCAIGMVHSSQPADKLSKAPMSAVSAAAAVPAVMQAAQLGPAQRQSQQQQQWQKQAHEQAVDKLAYALSIPQGAAHWHAAAAIAAIEGPPAKRHCQQQDTEQLQNQLAAMTAAGIGGSMWQAESPMPAKVLFQIAPSGRTMDANMPDATPARHQSAVVGAADTAAAAHVGAAAHTAAEVKAAEVAGSGQGVEVLPQIDPADVAEAESSDSDDELASGYGVFSQAGAMARIQRYTQRMDAEHRKQQQKQQPDAGAGSDSDYEGPRAPGAGAAAAANVTARDFATQAADCPRPRVPDAADPSAKPHHQSGGHGSPNDISSHMSLDEEHLALASYLPAPVVEVYRAQGLTHELYRWQAECLNQPGVLEGANLVYCAPTSGGKSLVAEVLMLRRLLTTQRPALLVMPFVSLCTQKAAHLKKLLEPMKREVKSLYGGLGGTPITAQTGVIVCTIEKANFLVNKMMEDDTLSQLGSVVVDELHMVGDEDRGYLLELLLTKLRYATMAAKEANDRRRAEQLKQLQRQHEIQAAASQQQGKSPGTPTIPDYRLCSANSSADSALLESHLQVIGMSATLPNVDQVANWLDAVLYRTDFRPVQLRQHIKVGRSIKNANDQVVCELMVPDGWEIQDPDHVALLAKETIDAGHSVLIFCGTKVQCEVVAKLVAKLLTIPERNIPVKGATQPAITPGADGSARAGFVAELHRISPKKDTAMKEVLAKGVAYHHSGLTNDERDLVEKAYGTGAVSVLCATSTLAAGVNLPARRVIFKHAWIGQPKNLLDPTRYRQMSGRAGRAGIDTEGESILLANQGNVTHLLHMMQASLSPISSCLVETRRGMKRAMLEVVAAGVVASSTDVERYLKCSLLAATEDYNDVAAASTVEALKWLCRKGFLRWQDESGGAYTATDLGKATAISGLNPEQALNVKQDLETARMGFCMATDLHLTYLVTPVQDEIRPDWNVLWNVIADARGPLAKVIEYVGLSHQYVQRQWRGMIRSGGAKSDRDKEDDRVARRFYAALLLTDLITEVPAQEVMDKFKLQQGQLEKLQENAGRFAATVAAFCERLNWSDLETLIANFQKRVFSGVRPEVLALTEIPYVKGARARLLYKAGLRTPEAVAASEVDRILEILMTGAPHNGAEPGQKRKNERKAAKLIIQGAKDWVSAKACELNAERDRLLAAVAGPAGTEAAGLPANLSVPNSPSAAMKYKASLQQRQGSQAADSQPQQQRQAQQQPGSQQQQAQQAVAQLSQQQRSQQHQQPQHTKGALFSYPGVQDSTQRSSRKQQQLQGQKQNATQSQHGQQQQWQQQAHSGPMQQAQSIANQQPFQQSHTPGQQQRGHGQSQPSGHWPPQHFSGTHPPQQLAQQHQQMQQHETAWPQQGAAQGGSNQLQQELQLTQWQLKQQQLPLQQRQQEQQLSMQQPTAQQQSWDQQGSRKRAGSPSKQPEHPAKRVAESVAAGGSFPTEQAAWRAPRQLQLQPGDNAVDRLQMPPPAAKPPQQLSIMQQQHLQPWQPALLPRSNLQASVEQQAHARLAGAHNPEASASTPAGGIASAALPADNGNSARPSPAAQAIPQPGVTIVKDAVGMQQLQDVLSVAPMWSFSLAFDTDTGGSTAAVLPPGLALPTPPVRRSGPGDESSRSSRVRSNPSDSDVAVGPVPDVDWLTGSYGRQGEEKGHPEQKQSWSWSVLGVAFSLGKQGTFYVPLTSFHSGSSGNTATAAQRAGTSERLLQLWSGLKTVFSQGHSSTGDRVAAVAAAAAAAEAAAKAGATNAAAASMSATSAPKPVLHKAALIPTTQWLLPQPVRTTFALKQQLALLANPPPPSGLQGINIADPVIDVRLAAWLLDPDAKLMEETAWGELGQKSLTKRLEDVFKTWGSDKDLIEAVASLRQPGSIGTGRHLAACKRACITYALYGKIGDVVKSERFVPALMGIEMPIVRVLASMEAHGIALDPAVLASQKPAMERRLRQLEEAAIKLNGGKKFNLGAPAEVARVLFEELQLPAPPIAKPKNPKARCLSTAAEVLNEMIGLHPMPGVILEHRKLQKLLGGFLEALADMVAKQQHADTQSHQLVGYSGTAGVFPGTDLALLATNNFKEVIRIRGQFMQTNTATGRLSMEDPSLQTIPRPIEYSVAMSPATQAAIDAATDDGVGGSPEARMQQHMSNIRAAFVAPPGCVLMSADYCQIELRLMAHFSADQQLLTALSLPDGDPFVTLAGQWLKVNKAEVTPEQRNHAKRLAYGLLYGMGAHALAAELGVTAQEATNLADDFRRSLAGLDAWIKGVIKGCQETAWVTMLAGRRRYLPAIKATGKDARSQRSHAERQAVNSVCQGSAADVVKGAMVQLCHQVEQQGLKQQCKLVLQVHDELLFEVSASHIAPVAQLVRHVMESAATTWGLRVHLPVKLAMGPSWGQLKEYNEQAAIGNDN